VLEYAEILDPKKGVSKIKKHALAIARGVDELAAEAGKVR